jgi:biotin synthase-related radical SAM superfamily protein
MFDEETMLMNGFDDCIVGIVERFNQPPIVCYDKTKVLQKLFEGGLEPEQAMEYFEFNQLGAWVGEKTPCFLTITDESCCLVQHD